ncbi:hypothetical protein GE118_03255 [Mycoplasma sp. NEAQ87857]|uniref:hypothetical protein n=1 Tax=Mycoplasma sp. NEAQ87857 TaxID=2683967 RepID=UPI00131931E7|nr:hypothetical protein [Mycoplasma sp. NEAQ87857]QGZ97807.1 hypothetical protein GE118_03255 [Mycoplasma sp. NEAQ87857]
MDKNYRLLGLYNVAISFVISLLGMLYFIFGYVYFIPSLKGGKYKIEIFLLAVSVIVFVIFAISLAMKLKNLKGLNASLKQSIKDDDEIKKVDFFDQEWAKKEVFIWKGIKKYLFNKYQASLKEAQETDEWYTIRKSYLKEALYKVEKRLLIINSLRKILGYLIFLPFLSAAAVYTVSVESNDLLIIISTVISTIFMLFLEFIAEVVFSYINKMYTNIVNENNLLNKYNQEQINKVDEYMNQVIYKENQLLYFAAAQYFLNEEDIAKANELDIKK